MPNAVTVFVSYCRKDVDWLERLRVHLTPFERSGHLVLWDDSRLTPGGQWRREIARAIDEAAAAILLLSADFLASEFISSEELPQLLHRATTRGARVLPIYVQPCRLGHCPQLTEFHALNSPRLPLSKLPMADAEEVFVKAADQLAAVFALAPAALRRQAEAPDPEEVSHQLFQDARFGLIVQVVLNRLATDTTTSGRTLTEISELGHLRCRRATFDAVQRLSSVGWLAKARRADRTTYVITPEGRRQLRRLQTASGGFDLPDVFSVNGAGSTPQMTSGDRR